MSRHWIVYSKRPMHEAPLKHRKSFKHWFVEQLHDYTGETDPRWHEAMQWCREQFGSPGGDRWCGLISDVVSCYICFKDEDDALAFRLRWC